ncbi:MAG TPA: hypothetical protein V6C72_05520 [Chroococcales cyanobacterium]|nr:hypothetical protein [Candidatus Saccharimonadales bacterium]
MKRSLTEILTDFGLLLFFMIADFGIYYTLGLKHNKAPLVAALIITIPATMLVGLAAYQSFKHRNDKEQW